MQATVTSWWLSTTPVVQSSGLSSLGHRVMIRLMELPSTHQETPVNPCPLAQSVSDATPPVFTEINPVPEKKHTDRPSYSFKTYKSGTLNFSGKCKGNVDKSVVGINHIALLTAEPGDSDDCILPLTYSSNNQSQRLKISPFVVVGGQS